MIIQDTLSGGGKKLDVTKKVRIYLCGVTVYDEAHIGHARTIIVFDVLRRFIESGGSEVELIQNFTDVDDKIIDRAKKDGTDASSISSRYIQEYGGEFDALNVRRATAYPMATEHIRDMLDLIEDLIHRKAAYAATNGVYFSISKFPEYGKLSKKDTAELRAGARIKVDEDKRDPLDFALWKFSDSEPSWGSPWGRGRPGWHIECSAMSLKYLGASFDIHGGGRDLIFPHHENEIAQSESHTERPMAEIWMHVGMITIDGEKMSKSAANIKSVKGLLQRWGPNVIRLFCIGGHYSKPIDYSEELLREHETGWNRARLAYHMLIQSEQRPGGARTEKIRRFRKEFDESLEDNLNTHLALNAFYGLVSFCHGLGEDLGQAAGEILPEFEAMMSILGLRIQKVSGEERDRIESMIRKRDVLREQKKYAEADRIRDELSGAGIEIKDEAQRTVWLSAERERRAA